jgi:hypothetical protein
MDAVLCDRHGNRVTRAIPCVHFPSQNLPDAIQIVNCDGGEVLQVRERTW